ncbi:MULTISPECIES: 16S rRNA (cytidine(1402)-2'-O)-methyltransferase [Acidiphilium]|uniref:16S rRNA (cytidine(1402)-2'-O)-methyltransferase n=1 Tax=Acidiphilium TaxID=522 RepID=UPI000556E361|nr:MULTISPECIES: 16S rRNA (cytidine(1402)-2'-O)-methyltransferase [Acidiphilium]MBS3024308.1 16S rRNA (cytidine(1402)-2'-O)-methyltransferase [Acidiphilium multivorum]
MSGVTSETPSSSSDALSRRQPDLVLVSTPIGNLGDLSPRAVGALRDADMILCEDTRVTAPLLAQHGIVTKLQSFHDHNEESRTASLIAMMQDGRRLALVSDAGAPLIADPGYRLVRAAIEAGLAVSAVPGPNAALMALALSGLPPHPFLFNGFLPPRAAARRSALQRLVAAEHAGLSATLVFYEAPHRLAACLEDCLAVLGDRPAAVGRELTKRFEEVRRGGLAALAAHYAAHEARGEITLVIGPAPQTSASEEELDEALGEALARMTIRDAAAFVARELDLPRKQVYARALSLKAGSP